MLEGPIHHAIAEGWWAPTAEYLNSNYDLNQSVIGVLNSALNTASIKGFEKGATSGKTEMEKWVTELPNQVAKHEVCVERIEKTKSRKSKKAAEIALKTLNISAIYTQLNFQFVAGWLSSPSPKDSDNWLLVLREKNWIHGLYNGYVDAFNACLETGNWRPFMNKDLHFEKNIDFHILKLAALYDALRETLK